MLMLITLVDTGMAAAHILFRVVLINLLVIGHHHQSLVVLMEQESLKLVEVLHGKRAVGQDVLENSQANK